MLISKRLILALAIIPILAIGLFFTWLAQPTIIHINAEKMEDGKSVPITMPWDYSVDKVNAPEGVQVEYTRGVIPAGTEHRIVFVDVPDAFQCITLACKPSSVQIELEVSK